MDWDAIKQRARAVVPGCALMPKRCWIVVLELQKYSQNELREEDFVWMIGHGKTSAQKVVETYQNRHDLHDVQLYCNGNAVTKSELIGAFLTPGENLVVFVASDPTQIDAQDPVLALLSGKHSDSGLNRGKDQDRAPGHTEAYSAQAMAERKTLQQYPFWLSTPSTTSSSCRDDIADAHLDGETPIVGMSRTNSRCSTAPRDALSARHNGDSSHANDSLPVANQTSVKDEVTLSPSLNSSLFPSVAEQRATSFDLDIVFRNDSFSEVSSQEKTYSLDRSIRQVIELQDANVLEAGVAQAVQLLQRVKQTFSYHTAANVDAASWLQAIDMLIPQAERKRSVIGVVGNTGGGKSSVINAMLDEERIVPTNCMRACTAVATEISQNSSTDPASKYRAEIEFIGPTDWEKELTIITQEFLSESGTFIREAQDPNTDAGIAWAKFHAVYPLITKDALHTFTITALMAKRAVTDVLGTTKHIHSAQPERFYRELQRYVDSKEKVKDKSKNSGRKPPREMEFWPLIKVVRIYTKSPALSTGAVIVDLPGVQDSNAARAAVAQDYMKQCTGLWIVAPINRAVDDKAAKTLLGDSFKRQLKYDGGFSSVTFICSKTDDISITEAVDSLQLEDENSELEAQSDDLSHQIESIKSKIDGFQELREVYRNAMSNANNDIEVWKGLQEQLSEGGRVYAPSIKTNKRKKIGSKEKQRKRRLAFEDDSDDDFFDSADGTDGSDDEVQFQAERTILSENDIKDKLKELKETTQNARRERLEIGRAMDELRPQIRQLQAKKDQIRVQIVRICIAGRNSYSKSAIQQDFAAGIKEIDQENAAEEDEDSFNPDEETRDYDQVAKSLPVFCVSSRAYQKICGRMQKDENVHGFLFTEETEIPQLQSHCRTLTETGRIQTSRSFLTSLCQLLTTFWLWTSNDSPDLKMTDEEGHKQVHHLKRRLMELKAGLENAVRACIKDMRVELKTQLFDKCPEIIDKAIEAAPATAYAWGHKDQGGLVWASYKAVVRRNGAYQSPAAGKRDFNHDLVDPIMKRLATGWERIFQTRLPNVFDTHIDNSNKVLQKFHETIEERAHNSGIGLANLSVLKTQISNYEQLFKDLGVSLVTQMNELQREANRNFTPCIANIMNTVYDLCTAEHGPGSFKRMKDHMKDHVDVARHKMFHETIQAVERHLDAMCETLQGSMDAKAEELFMQMNRDYMQALGGETGKQFLSLQFKEECELRADIRQILEGIDAQFESIARGDLTSPGATARETDANQGEQTHIDMGHESLSDSDVDDADDDDEGVNTASHVSTAKPTSCKQPYVEDEVDGGM